VDWQYELVIPRQCVGKRSPVWIALHGRGGNPEQIIDGPKLADLAAKHGFILIAPQAQNNGVWQDLYGEPGQKGDLAFFSKLLDAIPSLGGDRRRVYVVGASNGGSMSYLLGAVFSQRIAAVMGSAASIGALDDNLDYYGLPDPQRPISCLMMHGMKDTINGYDMSTFTLALPDAAAWWAKRIGASGPPQHSELGHHQLLEDRYVGNGGAEVILYSDKNGGHEWASDSDSRTGLNGNEMIWQFFQRHPLS
jgi:polyhydroxybutyrate depolymerase